MRYLLLLLPMFLMGCSMIPTTTGNREYDIRVDIQNNLGPVTLTFPLNVDAQTKTEVDAQGNASVTPDVNFQLTQPGSSGAMAGADALLKDTVSKYKQTLREEKIKEVIENLPEVDEPPVLSPPADIPPPTGDLTREDGTYHGRPNGDRPQWYFKKDLKDYPRTIILDIPDCYDNKIISHNGIRYDVDSLVLKQSDVAGRHMAILAPQSCKSEIATITY